MIRYALAMLLMTAAATSALAQDAGLAAWGKIYEVFSHPRCANCHVGPDNVPMWSGPEYGPVARPHGMNIIAGGKDRTDIIDGGEGRTGVEHITCRVCHTQHNSQLPHGPPGALVWQLPPVSMVWFGKSSAEICAQIKDPTRNGGRTIIPDVSERIKSVSEHIAGDELVAWGWAPGPERKPAPYSPAQLVEFLEQWDAAGAPCPTQ